MGVMARERGALWGSGGLWGALWAMGRVMACMAFRAEGAWLRDSTVEGMRHGDRLEVPVARSRGLCWEEPPAALVRVQGPWLLLPPSGRGPGCKPSGVLACWGDAPRDSPPEAPSQAAGGRGSGGEP